MQVLFAENSNFQLPVGWAREIVEIMDWVEKELKELNNDELKNKNHEQ
jgi:hypothetical protein